MEKEIVNKKSKAGVPVKAGLIIMMIVSGLVIANTVTKEMVIEIEEEPVWQVIQKFSPLGAEADPGSGVESGWLSFFVLDYAETPASTIGNSNATNGAYDAWGNVSGYQNTDDAEAMDLASEDPGYFVGRARFNKTHCWDGSKFMDNRCSIRLTVSGDETISDVEGTRAVSYNDTGEDWIWINFYWDDASDGYRITDDGTLTWNVTISAKF